MTSALSAVRMSSHLARYSGLLSGWEAQMYSLPADLEAAFGRLCEVHALLPTIPALTVQETKTAWMADVVQSALSDQPMPSLDKLAEDTATATRAERDREVLFACVQSLGLHISQALTRRSHTLFDECVLPAFVVLMAEVNQVRDDLGAPRTAEQALRGDETQRAAWVRLPDLSRRYDRLRDAALCLDQHSYGMSEFGREHDLPDLTNDVDLLDVALPTPSHDLASSVVEA